uniref:Uncharacterized protein n=1 Tax=Cannabis sativa TaxID=3483 RepID=A0A803QR89_CANSA
MSLVKDHLITELRRQQIRRSEESSENAIPFPSGLMIPKLSFGFNLSRGEGNVDYYLHLLLRIRAQEYPHLPLPVSRTVTKREIASLDFGKEIDLLIATVSRLRESCDHLPEPNPATINLTLPLLASTGVAPFQFIPQVYSLSSRWYVLYVKHGKLAPTPKDVLYFYHIKSQSMRGYKDKVGFYRFQTYSTSIPYPTSHTRHMHDFKDYYFFTSGFPLRRVPTLSLDISLVNQLATLWIGHQNKFLGSVQALSCEIREMAQSDGDGGKNQVSGSGSEEPNTSSIKFGSYSKGSGYGGGVYHYHGLD